VNLIKEIAMGHRACKVFLMLAVLTGINVSTTQASALKDKNSSIARPSIFLTKESNNNLPQDKPYTDFNCTDTIYAVMNGDWRKGTDHTFEAFWSDPKGTQQEHSRITFKSVGATQVTVWLRLHRGDENVLARFFGLAEDSMQSFIGRWKVDFYLDGKKLSRLHFNVSC
jgi:hypothetical protein